MTTDIVSLVFLVLIQLTSFSCALFILIEYGKKQSPLRRLPNHLIICLLIVSIWLITFDLFSTEFYYYSRSVLIHTAWACRLYNLSFLSMSGLNHMFMAFMSVERHFLVFRIQLYHTHRSRLKFHYIPIILIILWIFIYSIITDVIVSCPQIRFRYSDYLCGFTCSLLQPNLALIHAWIQVFLPTSITIIACILLPIRFAIQKRNLQRFQWRQARKMIIQMIFIAGAYTICWFPYTIFLQLFYVNPLLFTNLNFVRFMIFAPYVTSLITPFICLYITSTWLKFNILKQIVHRCFHNTIHPQTQNHIVPNQ